MNPRDEQKLERLVHQTLRELPPRHAPHTLESRVLAEIERRAALPWWKQSFAHWPAAPRFTFLVLSAASVALVLFGGFQALASVSATPWRDAFGAHFAWLEFGFSIGRTLFESVQAALRSIPPLWLYGGMAFIATMYAALFGLGATAYRTLFVSR